MKLAAPSALIAAILWAAARAALGYGRLPRNLLAGGLREVGHIPGHVTVPALARCVAKARVAGS